MCAIQNVQAECSSQQRPGTAFSSTTPCTRRPHSLHHHLINHPPVPDVLRCSTACQLGAQSACPHAGFCCTQWPSLCLPTLRSTTEALAATLPPCPQSWVLSSQRAPPQPTLRMTLELGSGYRTASAISLFRVAFGSKYQAAWPQAQAMWQAAVIPAQRGAWIWGRKHGPL